MEVSSYTELEVFIKLLLTVLSPSNLECVEPKEGSVNTVIVALSPEKQTCRDGGQVGNPLTSTQRRNNVVNSYNDLIDGVNMYFPSTHPRRPRLST